MKEQRNHKVTFKVPLYVGWRLTVATWALRVYVRMLDVSEDEGGAMQEMFQRHGIRFVKDRTHME